MSSYNTSCYQVSEKKNILYVLKYVTKKVPALRTMKVFLKLTGDVDNGSYVVYALVLPNMNTRFISDSQRPLDFI